MCRIFFQSGIRLSKIRICVSPNYHTYGIYTRFGAKLSASYFGGYVFLDHMSWDNFNESGDSKAQVEAFKNSMGSYR